MSQLFQPLSLRSLTLKNRIAVSPMCQYSSDDGFANDWHLVHLGARAAGGAALIITEATAVSPEGRISPKDLGLWKREHIPGLARITAFIRSQNAIPGIQLSHAGRKASHQPPANGGRIIPPNQAGGWQTLAPSPIAYHHGDPEPQEMTNADIEKCIADFVQTAKWALEAGFQVAEIHAAHGYLLNNFLSPLTNKRTDAYGGSFENRVKLLLEIVREIRKAWPDELPLVVRISATEWTEGGWTPEDSVALARLLAAAGTDLIDCSTGGNYFAQQIPVGPLYQLPFAQKIKEETGIATGAVGMITTAAQCEQIIANKQADIVLLARQMLRDPHFALHAAKELGADATWPLQYQRAKI